MSAFLTRSLPMQMPFAAVHSSRLLQSPLLLLRQAMGYQCHGPQQFRALHHTPALSMAGHSKWANIKHRKGAQDAKKSKVFAKFSKEIMNAARKGGTNVDENFHLRSVLHEARKLNIPNTVIDKAIAKATGAGAEAHEEVFYEGTAGGGTFFMVHCLTDNTTRTSNEVRFLFKKNHCQMGNKGNAAFMFDHLGCIEIPATINTEKKDSSVDPNRTLDELYEIVLNTDLAVDIKIEDNYSHMLVYCESKELGNLNKALQAQGVMSSSVKLVYVAKDPVVLYDEEVVEQIEGLLHALHDHDDVSEIYHNIKDDNDDEDDSDE